MTNNHGPELPGPKDPHPALERTVLGALELENKLSVAPMSRTSATASGSATTQMADYYRRFGVGGFGLVISEGIYTDARRSQSYDHQPGLVTDDHVRHWATVVEAVHATGTPIIAQLMHGGALSQSTNLDGGTVGPSSVQPLGRMLRDYGGSGPYAMPQPMTQDGINKVVVDFVAAAHRARRAGFDGIEVHGANGYLLDQFITTYTNLRSDQYGGCVENRARLAAEVVRAIRDELPAGLPVGIRLSQTKVNDVAYRWPGGADEAKIIFGAMAEAGANFLHLASEGDDWWRTAQLEDAQTVTGLAREVTGLPVIANGGMDDLDLARTVLDDGHADLLSFARAALANPDLPQRLSKGSPLRPFDAQMLRPRATLDNAEAWSSQSQDGAAEASTSATTSSSTSLARMRSRTSSSNR